MFYGFDLIIFRNIRIGKFGELEKFSANYEGKFFFLVLSNCEKIRNFENW